MINDLGCTTKLESNRRFGNSLFCQRFSLLILTFLIAAFASTGFAQGMLEPMGPVAEAQRTHLLQVVMISLIAIVPVIVGVPILLIIYRRKGDGRYSPELEFSLPIELVFWGVPICILFVLGYGVVQYNRALDPYKPLGPDPLQVQVIGLDWKWVFIYPEQERASVGTLVVPAGQPVELSMTSDTVMQSLLIPQVAGQVYSMPGMVSKLNFLVDEPGETHGMNAQYAGDGFVDQTMVLQAVADADWQAWVAQGAGALALDDQSYQILAKSGSMTDALSELGSSDGLMQLAKPDLFEQVVMRYHSGEAVDAASQPGSPEYNGGAAQ